MSAIGTPALPLRRAGEAQPAATLPRLLAGVPARGSIGLDDHLELHGELALAHAGRRRAREHAAALIEEVRRAGLLGRGGAAFPMAVKMRAVAAGRRRAVVVANAAEGEPASLKDRTLLELAPHLVLDGALAAAHAVGADEAIVCVCESAPARAGAEAAGRAIAERERMAGRSPRLRLATVPGHYVAGQESALVAHLNGAPARPTFTPPLPFEQGVARRPTLVNNAETLGHLALIARHGAGWFRQLGTAAQPGSALVTLSGPVAHPGVYEIEHGASLASLVEAAGGTAEPLRAALIGGYAGSWIGAEHLRAVALSNEQLAPLGASLGAGVVVLLSQSACPVAETARLARWLAGQSARQCGPCVHGLDALATTVAALAGGRTGAGADARIERLAALVSGRGACAHPDGAARVIRSAMEVFAAELADHARHGPCDDCARPAELPLPARPVPAPSQRKADPSR